MSSKKTKIRCSIVSKRRSEFFRSYFITIKPETVPDFRPVEMFVSAKQYNDLSIGEMVTVGWNRVTRDAYQLVLA